MKVALQEPGVSTGGKEMGSASRNCCLKVHRERKDGLGNCLRRRKDCRKFLCF